MIHLIIWSKDRAAQLECLLDSIKRYTPGLFVISVLYTHSGQEFGLAYQKLLDDEDNLFDYDCSCMFPEHDFYQQTISFVKDKGSNLVCFMTDDTVLFQRPGAEIDYDKIIDEETATFSFRLGLNTTLQNCFAGQMQPPLTNHIFDINTPEIIKWQFRDYHQLLNYGYPCGLDGHIFKRELLEKMLDFQFKSTNELESGMFRRQDILPPMMKSFTHSVAVNIPKNNVTGATKSEGVSLCEMNAKFLSGKRLRLKEGQHVIGSHQLLEMLWV